MLDRDLVRRNRAVAFVKYILYFMLQSRDRNIDIWTYIPYFNITLVVVILTYRVLSIF